MKKELFREESLKKIENPSDLDKYVRVTNPSTWILLAALVVLLVGGCVWGFFGQLNSTIPGTCVVDTGRVHGIVKYEDVSLINPGMKIKISETYGEISETATFPRILGEFSEEYGYSVPQSDYNIKIAEFYGKTSAKDGLYTVEIITETKTPFSFLFNSAN